MFEVKRAVEIGNCSRSLLAINGAFRYQLAIGRTGSQKLHQLLSEPSVLLLKLPAELSAQIGIDDQFRFYAHLGIAQCDVLQILDHGLAAVYRVFETVWRIWNFPDGEQLTVVSEEKGFLRRLRILEIFEVHQVHIAQVESRLDREQYAREDDHEKCEVLEITQIIFISAFQKFKFYHYDYVVQSTIKQ